MNALITRTHINSELDVCEMGTESTPEKLKFTIETDENEEFGFGIEFEVGFMDEELDEIEWESMSIIDPYSPESASRLEKFLKVFKDELEKDFKEKNLKNVDSVLIVWNTIQKHDFFIQWQGSEYEKYEFAKKLSKDINDRDIAELAQEKYFSSGFISLQLLNDLDHAKTKMALITY